MLYFFCAVTPSPQGRENQVAEDSLGQYSVAKHRSLNYELNGAHPRLLVEEEQYEIASSL